MRKLTFLALIAAFMLPITAQAETTVIDNLGRKWVIDEATAATPGAGSGLGEIVGLESAELPSYEQHMIDLQFQLGATGTEGDDTLSTENAVVGFTLFYYAADWLKIGPQIGTTLGEGSKMIDFSVPVEFILFPDPFSSVIWKFRANVFTYTVTTSDDVTMPIKSAWSFDPAGSFVVEVPMGAYSVDFGAGVSYPFSIMGVTDEELNNAVKKATAGVAVSINYRMR